VIRTRATLIILLPARIRCDVVGADKGGEDGIRQRVALAAGDMITIRDCGSNHLP
jgi:hypothetical protein